MMSFNYIPILSALTGYPVDRSDLFVGYCFINGCQGISDFYMMLFVPRRRVCTAGSWLTAPTTGEVCSFFSPSASILKNI